MKTGFLLLFFVPLFAYPQATNTNQVASVPLGVTNYSRLNLRDRSSWSSAIQAQRVNNAAAWQKLWTKMWGWRFNAAPAATNSVQQAPPVNSPPVVQPPVAQPPVQAPQQTPQLGSTNSNLQSAINIDNLNNTVWRDSGWQMVNPYESLLRDYRAAARAQRDFAMNPMSQTGSYQMNNSSYPQMNNQMNPGGMGVFNNQGQMGNYQQQGGSYGNPNNGMGGYGNMFGGGFASGNAPQGMNMNNYSMGYSGVNTQVAPYF